MPLSRLVFLDKVGTKKKARACDYGPHSRWKATTLVAALTVRSAIAPMVFDSPMDRASFEAYVAQALIPALIPGAIVMMDNLSAHKSPAIEATLLGAGALLWYLPLQPRLQSY